MSSTPSSGEKKEAEAVERLDSLPKDEASIPDRGQPEYDDKETKRLLRKIDWRLMPILALLYLLAFLDRGNIAIAGMNEDLGLTGAQYNMALTVFFFPYAIFEVPSNIILKMMKPSLWISILMVLWGIVMTLQGIVQSYEHLIVTRVLLGLFESGIFPAATYLLTTWYCRFEVQTRLAVFFSVASAASAFSGLLAFAIQKMDGIGGQAGWRWIFILEGILTVLIGSTLYFILPDSPQTSSWLTPSESTHILTRLSLDSGTSTGRVGTQDNFSLPVLKSALLEWKLYLAVIIYWGNGITIYGFTYCAPSIILGLGYPAANAQLLTIPIYALGVIRTIIFSRWADKRQTRWPFIMIPYSIAAVGFIGLLAVPHPRYPGLTYGLLFPRASGDIPTSHWNLSLELEITFPQLGSEL